MINSLLNIPTSSDGLPLIGLALIAICASVLARYARRHLASTGLLPRICTGTEHLGRSLAVIFIILGFAPLLPHPLSTALPLVLVGAGAAIGWSLREVAEDWIAGIVILLERKVQRGDWIEVDRQSGTIIKLGARAVTLECKDHTLATIPNRALLINLRVSPPNQIPFEVLVRLANEEPYIAERIKSIAAVSPWVSSLSEPVVGADPLRPGIYSVQVKLLEADMADRFTTAMIAAISELNNPKEK